jgi:hypothetical protein
VKGLASIESMPEEAETASFRSESSEEEDCGREGERALPGRR